MKILQKKFAHETGKFTPTRDHQPDFVSASSKTPFHGSKIEREQRQGGGEDHDHHRTLAVKLTLGLFETRVVLPSSAKASLYDYASHVHRHK
jgi:hypothetical protein